MVISNFFRKLFRLTIVVLSFSSLVPCSSDAKQINKYQMQHHRSTKPTFYEDNPTYLKLIDDSAQWKFSAPENQNIDAQLLEAAAKDLGQRENLWSFLVIRHGQMVFERYFNGSNAKASNNIHSASKSILSAAIGIALAKGYIRSVDQPVSELIPKHFRGIKDARKLGITIRHLLTMQGGLEWVEDKTEYEIEDEKNWIKAILNLPQESMPGDHFHYSTALTHLMSAILSDSTNNNTHNFVDRNLFGKIGIKAQHWGKDPQKYYSGGYNLYLTPRDLAKFGMLYLNGGSWQGEAIVPASWVEASLHKQVNALEGVYYGYNWWLRKVAGFDVAFAWGFGGQYLYLIKELDLVVVMTTNTQKEFPDFEGEAVLTKYVLPSIK